jgi:UPF0176 protein
MINTMHLLTQNLEQKTKQNLNHQVLLFYKFIKINNPDAVVLSQKNLCSSLELKGRILISQEGINGTVEGTIEQTELYIKAMLKDDLFDDISYKKSLTNGKSFPKMQIKARSEIVTTGLPYNLEIGPLAGLTGKYISAKELHELIHSDQEFYIIDMRNDYEFKVGHFDRSIMPKAFKNFRDLPLILDEISHLKDKKIVTVCTGGVRCEKASGFLMYHGFKDVYQLHDGIVTYMEAYPNEDFLGKLYVFDNRLMMGFNTDSSQHTIIGKCDICSVECEDMVDYYYNPDSLADPKVKGTRAHGPVCANCRTKPGFVLD